MDATGWRRDSATPDAMGSVDDFEFIAQHLASVGPRRKQTTDADDDGELVIKQQSAPFVPPDATAANLARDAFDYLFAGTGLVLSTDARAGQFYAYRWLITNVFGTQAGMIELGGSLTLRKGKLPSLRFELTGLGCRLFEGSEDASADHAQRWCAFRAKLERIDAQLSRVDVAFDDFDGTRNLALARCMYEIGEFDYTFGGETKRPKFKDIRNSPESGDTFYVGHASSERLLRVYDKGKQLGDQESPWVRWEAQLKSSSRKKLPLDVLEDPTAFMRGAFACLDFVSKVLERIATTRETSKATLKSVARHIRRQYGGTLHQLRRMAPNDLEFLGALLAMERDATPKWAKSGRPKWEDVRVLQPDPLHEH